MDYKLNLLTQKKQELDKLQPLPRDVVTNLEGWFKVELTYSSNAIEGNTLSRIETAEVIERGTAAVISGKPLKDQLEAINHAKALEFIKELAKQRKGHQFITEEDIKALHKIILTGIRDDWAGRYRATDVHIKGVDVELPSPQRVIYLMNDFANWLTVQQEEHPVRVAAGAHLKLVSIHPFSDGNGRTARLLMNLILILNGYPMAVLRNEDRTKYLDVIYQAQTKNTTSLYYDFIENAAGRSLDAYINAAKGKPVMPRLKTPKVVSYGKSLRIGQLAQLTNETVATLRFWAKEGLIRVKGYTPGGYQLFEPSVVDGIKKIRKLQGERRLTIAEIRKELNGF